MFCESCGKELRAGVKFCGNCGAKAEAGTVEGSNKLRSFSCRQLVFNIFEYDTDHFSDIDLSEEYKKWGEDFASDSVAAPLLEGSPFYSQEGCLGLGLAEYECAENEKTYVVVYELNQRSTYLVSEDVGGGWVVNPCAVLPDLKENGLPKFGTPIASFSLDAREERPERQFAHSVSKVKVAIFVGKILALESRLEDFPKLVAAAGGDEEETESFERESKGRLVFEWKMERGAINADDLWGDGVPEALNEVRKLLENGAVDDALRKLPPLSFEFSLGGLDGDPSAYFESTDDIAFDIDIDDSRNHVEIDIDDDKFLLSVSVKFELPVKKGVDSNELTDWLADNGGYSAGFVTGGWSYDGDEGGCIAVTSTDSE